MLQRSLLSSALWLARSDLGQIAKAGPGVLIYLPLCLLITEVQVCPTLPGNLFCFVRVFQTGSHLVAQAALELTGMLLPCLSPPVLML